MHRETLWLPGHLGSTELSQTFYQWIKMNGYIAKRGTNWFLGRSSAVPQFRSCRFSGKPSQATRLVALKPARTFTCRRGTRNGGKRGGRDVELDSYDMIHIGAIQRVQRSFPDLCVLRLRIKAR